MFSWWADGPVRRDVGESAVNLDRQSILERIRAEAPGLRAKYGVKSLAVFGSMARGDDHEGSDVDVLVTFEGPARFDNFMGLKLDLEDLFGRRVDLLTPKSLGPAMRAEIDEEAILVP
jgi:predicted nucleotidyltransferase